MSLYMIPYIDYFVYDFFMYYTKIGNNPEELMCELRNLTGKLFIWFVQNELKANFSKS